MFIITYSTITITLAVTTAITTITLLILLLLDYYMYILQLKSVVDILYSYYYNLYNYNITRIVSSSNFGCCTIIVATALTGVNCQLNDTNHRQPIRFC